MDIQFELAEAKDMNEIFRIYQQAIAHMNHSGIYQWDDMYPNYDDISEDIEKGQLHIGKIGTAIVAAFAVNDDSDEQYKNGAWIDRSNNFLVIHRLCVHPAFQNMGIAKKVVQTIENEARQSGIKSIRLDVFAENPYALRLYRSSGFSTVGEASFRKGKFFLMEKVL